MMDVERITYDLENKLRQKPKIAHEVGAGSQCYNCGPKCIGFDLHFWRKICRNCRCSKDDHAVKEEDDSSRVVRLLLNDPPVANHHQNEHGDTPLNRQRPITKPQPALGLGQRNNAQMAPSLSKVPAPLSATAEGGAPSSAPAPAASGSSDLERKRALDRQLPVHDLEPEKCINLSPSDKKKMEEYVNNVKQFAVGRGLIQVASSLGGATPSPPLPSAQIPLRKTFSPEIVPGSVPHPTGLHNKLPGPPPDLNRILGQKISNLNQKPFTEATPPPSSRPLPKFMTGPKPFVPTTEPNLPPPPPSGADVIRRDGYLETDIDDLPPPPPELMEDDDSHDPSLRELMTFIEEVSAGPPGRKSSGFTPAKLGSASKFNATPRPFGTATPPSNSSPNLNVRPTASAGSSPLLSSRLPAGGKPAQLSNSNNTNNNVPALNNNEETTLLRTLAGKDKQLEGKLKILADSPGLKANPTMHEVEVVHEAEKIWLCQNCTDPIRAGETAIFAERAGSDKCWHPQCFTCSICNEALADLIYFFVDDSIFCGRHYAEKMKIPRCKACDELIWAPEYTSAEGATWHTDHFCCWICDTPLAGHQYTPIEGQPHCLDCYQKKHGKDCYSCKRAIRADEARVSHAEMNWHADASCFHCFNCHTSMINRQFLLRNQQIYCSRDCAVGPPKHPASVLENPA